MKLVIAKGIFRRIDEAIFLERSRRISFCEIARRVAILRDSKICELIWFKPVWFFVSGSRGTGLNRASRKASVTKDADLQ